jgi:molybdate transport system ATP-binding protein
MTIRSLVEIADVECDGLEIASWRVRAGEAWCVFGRNGSGKQLLDRLLTRDLTPRKGQLSLAIASSKIRLVSFETQQAIYEEERRLAVGDWIADDEQGTRVEDFLPRNKLEDPLIDILRMRHRLRAFYRELSTGESRKLLVLKAILEDAQLLLCDNPFDSLDQQSVAALSDALAQAVTRGISVVLLLSNRSDIPAWVQHFALVECGRMTLLSADAGPAQRALLDEQIAGLVSEQPSLPEDAIALESYEAPYIAELNACTVRYGGRPVLDALTLKIAPLQHTLVTGENGAGKSTLLGLITGDCLQCFSNDVTVFGHRRGTGESVWDIKRHLGLVGSDLHRRYSVRCDVLSAVCSGFFDSIGLYDTPSEFQVRIAREWLAAIEMSDKASVGFQSLSYGEQRLVLIARAMVKSPLLLVLDEPTQGLDEINRERILGFMSAIEARQHSTLLFVSHREDEFLPLFKQHVHLRLNL